MRKSVRRRRANHARQLLEWVARKYMMSTKTLKGEERFPHIVAARKEFIQLAYSKGIGSTTIAKTLHRNENTVRYHLRPDVQLARHERYLARRRLTHPPGENHEHPAI
jgi:DNA-binding NarL/FixJ family response regulator